MYHSQKPVYKLSDTKLLNCTVWLSGMRKYLLWFEINGMNNTLKKRTLPLCLWPSIIENISLLDYSFNIGLLVPQDFQ